jgi:hypothetical protein
MNKNLILSILLLLVASNTYSQVYIIRDKAFAKKSFAKYSVKSKVKTMVVETDTTLRLLVRDSSVQNLDIILHYDKFGKCDSEQYLLSCDSCYQKFLKETLSNPFSRWTKIDSNTYFARFPYRVILTAKLENSYSYLLEKSKMEGSVYRKIVRESLNN